MCKCRCFTETGYEKPETIHSSIFWPGHKPVRCACVMTNHTDANDPPFSANPVVPPFERMHGDDVAIAAGGGCWVGGRGTHYL